MIKPELVLIRGLPGSGKTSLAKMMTGHEHLEADQFFTSHDGTYIYDQEKVKDAHEWCQRETMRALANGKNVVVSNTFTRRFEMEPYFRMCESLGILTVVIETRGNYPNVHGVDDEMLDRMRNRWEPTESLQDVAVVRSTFC